MLAYEATSMPAHSHNIPVSGPLISGLLIRNSMIYAPNMNNTACMPRKTHKPTTPICIHTATRLESAGQMETN